MPGLLDIAASARTVDVNGLAVPVYGVSARGIAVLFERFPALRALFTGKQDANFSPEALIELVPDAIACVIACGCGDPGHYEAEQVASRLPAGSQADLLKAILELTMPEGIGPFAEKLTELAGAVGVESMNIPDTKSPAQSSA